MVNSFSSRISHILAFAFTQTHTHTYAHTHKLVIQWCGVSKPRVHYFFSCFMFQIFLYGKTLAQVPNIESNCEKEMWLKIIWNIKQREKDSKKTGLRYYLCMRFVWYACVCMCVC